MSLDDHTRSLLEQALGVRAPETPPVDADSLELPESRLSPQMQDMLAGVVGGEQVLRDRAARLTHAAGKSTPDLLRLRRGEVVSAPDAVVLPGSHDEVVAVLSACSRGRVAVVPFGGGTSVVGGVAALRGDFESVVALDVRRLASLIHIDAESMTATMQAGLKAPEAEGLLSAAGFTLGHFPQSFEHASIGGFAATRSVGQASAGYGRFDDLVLDLRVATPAGSLGLGRGPASAAGPDLRQLMLGSEGVLGVITEVTVQVRPIPPVRIDETWTFADFATGVAALRRIAQCGVRATITRLSDEAETAVNRLLEDANAEGSTGCQAVIGYEGERTEVDARRGVVTDLLEQAGGQRDGGGAAPSDGEGGEGGGDRGWRASRFQAPYLRDALLDAGALVETLETATTWSRLTVLAAGVRDAITSMLTAAGTAPMVMCHVSHIYPSGASLYFTVVGASGERPIERWYGAKRAAGDVISAAGATITHHHAVGVDHRAWMGEEIGDLGVQILHAVKASVDPVGILNPGKLIPLG